jgi:hypothetical protein
LVLGNFQRSSYEGSFKPFTKVKEVFKSRWVGVRLSGRVYSVVKAAASIAGVSVSEFVRQAILERLERMNVMGSEVKAALAKEVEGAAELADVRRARGR